MSKVSCSRGHQEIDYERFGSCPLCQMMLKYRDAESSCFDLENALKATLAENKRLKDEMLCAMTVARENPDRFAVVDMSAKIDPRLLGMDPTPKGMASPEDHRKMMERIFDLERQNKAAELRNGFLEQCVKQLTNDIEKLKEPLIAAITVVREQERKGDAS